MTSTMVSMKLNGQLGRIQPSAACPTAVGALLVHSCKFQYMGQKIDHLPRNGMLWT
eukprot:SAG31_NODE_26453_length_442_cov_0.650146_2_plen_55_part_01